MEMGFRSVRFEEVIGVDQESMMRSVFCMSIGLEVGDGFGNNYKVVFREMVVGMRLSVWDESYVGFLGRDFLWYF